MRKHLILFLTAILAIGLASCEKAVIDEPGGKKEKVTKIITINPTEEQIEISESPMTRGIVAGKIYAVNVFKKKKGAKSYSKYAYGLFTDPSKIAVAMTEGYLYKVECMVVQDDGEALYNKDGEYLAPFLHGDVKPTKAGNVFVKSSSENLGSLTKGDTNISESEIAKYPKMYKQYGTVEDFDPSTSDRLTLTMKRAVFGLHFKITPPEEGTLTVSYLFRTITVKSTDAACDQSSVYSFYTIDAAAQEDYQGTVSMNLKWEKSDGTTEEDGKEITLKRNTMTNINISAEGPAPKEINITEETGAMKEETVGWDLKVK